MYSPNSLSTMVYGQVFCIIIIIIIIKIIILYFKKVTQLTNKVNLPCGLQYKIGLQKNKICIERIQIMIAIIHKVIHVYTVMQT
jgi:hypothetical protein